jgi:heptaprenyl diphosphate synthase
VQNSRWGNSVAILTGDYLFAKMSQILAELGPEAVKLQADTFERLVIGQIQETQGPGSSDPLEHYLQVVADKTGSSNCYLTSLWCDVCRMQQRRD